MENPDHGHDRLWNWFGLSYASFLVLPRMLMHAMPDNWQDRMATLLQEYDDMYPNRPDIGCRVQATTPTGSRLIAMPKWLCRYRRPDREMIAWSKGTRDE